QAARGDVYYCEVGVHALHHADAGQRIAAALDDLGFPLLGEVLHHHPHALRAHGEVHRAAHGRDGVATAVPVREAAGYGHLERAEHGDVEVAAAHHSEGIGVVEVGAASEQRHRLLSGVDEIRVLLTLRGRRTHAEDAVLAVQEDLALFRQVVADQCRH